MFHTVTLDPIGLLALVIGCMLIGCTLFTAAMAISELIAAKIIKRALKSNKQKGL